MASLTGKDGSAHTAEQDLSTLLTSEERGELTLLIANITQVMQKKITDTFDTSINMGKIPQQALNIIDDNPNIKPHEETEEEEKSRKTREKHEKELSAPKMLELKKATLEFFQKWQESVISRVGIVVNKQDVVENQKEKPSTTTTTDAVAMPDTKTVSKLTSQLR